ncbi:MAG: helix-turn-helix domain-containing protein [Candidatus Hydrogenedentes bacterium]|nr:helix-turn-helix domain-containing protein [Candidatus Hydrogenedentota bacterium]
MNERLLNVRDVAARMNVSTRAVWNYRDVGFMPAPLKVGGAVRWREKDIDSWIAAGCPDMRRGVQP